MMVTRGNGRTQLTANKRSADESRRALDSVSRAQKKQRKKKKAKRQPCFVPGIHRLYTVEEAASYLRLSTWTVRGLGWNGEVPQVKIGRRVRYDREDLDKFIEQSKGRR